VCTVSVKRNCDALQVKRPAVDSFVAVAIRVMIIVIIQYILSRQYFYYIYTMPCICNTKITCRIHLIAPRHAFCFDLHDSKIQYAFFSTFTVVQKVLPPPLHDRRRIGVNKNHVAETHALISLSRSSERS